MNKYGVRILFSIIAGILLILAVYLLSNFENYSKNCKVENVDSIEEEFTRVIAQDLQSPWALTFTKDGEIFFTEKSGKIRFINKSGKLFDDPIWELSDVKNEKEAGLLGIAVHPNFLINKYVYLYYTFKIEEEQTLNRVVRFIFNEISLGERKTIIDNIPGSVSHSGGRINFGPDGYLYIATGDTPKSSANDNNSLSGKILRVNDFGDPAPGNILGNRIYSFGFTNPTGIAWDEKNNLWVKDVSDKGINLYLAKLGEKGVLHSEIVGQNNTISNLCFLNGKLIIGGLDKKTIYTFSPDETKSHFINGEREIENFGIIKEVIIGSDGWLYLTTNNSKQDSESETVDKIIKVNPQKI